MEVFLFKHPGKRMYESCRFAIPMATGKHNRPILPHPSADEQFFMENEDIRTQRVYIGR